ncbi:MAG TPA: acyl-CoA synthetase, partial [Acidimicrobiales bacterium]|nr:acyl-CoA synthetase [Acidimicrobiales bacterium]
VCVGLPDERFGERVCALVQRDGSTAVSEADVTEAVRAELAGYKVPRTVFFVETIGRSPAGKVDYPGLKKKASELAG